MKDARVTARKILSSVDELALIRTKLANERTFLAYLRTFVGSFVAGVGLIEFTGNLLSLYTGIALLAVAPVILAVGIVRVVKAKKSIAYSNMGADKTEDAIEQAERKA